MESFRKKLQELRDILKAAKPSAQSMHPELPKLPEIKPTPAPSISSGATLKTPKMPGINPGSKKDPRKVAEQLKQGKTQQKMMPKLEISKSGQWSLNEDIEKASFADIKPKPKADPSKPLRFPDLPEHHPFNRAKDSDIIPFNDSHVDITKPPKPPKK